MIEELHIEGFKRFENQVFRFKPLTVLAGRNGAGKTTVIHALLLIRHAMQRRDCIAELNGPFGLELGWFESILNVNVRDNVFSIGVRGSDGEAAKWTFSQGDTELYATVTGPEIGPPPFDRSWSRAFQYLAAERNGPRITQKESSVPAELLTVGSQGEFTAQVIENLGSRVVEAARLVPEADIPPLVKAQTEQWLSRIVRPIQIDTSRFSGTGITSLTFSTPGGTPVRPTNMGFGVTYALPIVLGALTAPMGGLLIVENPEAHLHPAGQSEIGVFLARMVAAGLQVLVETHSDHVLNGFRRAIGESKCLRAEGAIVHFFEEADPSVKSLTFTHTGGMSDWPAGFFDQYQLDVSRLTRIRRPR